MHYTECGQKIHRILASRRTPISKKQLTEELGCNEKTIRRTIQFLQNQAGAPIRIAKEPRGYYYDHKQTDKYQLPGFWFTSEELQSLALLLQLLETCSHGLFTDDFKAIDSSIEALLSANKIDRNEFNQVLRIIPLTTRHTNPQHFHTIYQSINNKRRLWLDYSDYQGDSSQRTVSPQRLLYYRENWYLDAWCHTREGLRTFSLARIKSMKINSDTIQKVPAEQLDQYFNPGFGIFGGAADKTAKLRFYQEVAREISLQQWHPKQQGEWQGQDYLLHVPYSQHTELVQDILRWSPYVLVEEPLELKKEVKKRLQAAINLHSEKDI